MRRPQKDTNTKPHPAPGPRAELEAHGVTFSADPLDSGVCHMAHFADPDGDALMFHCRYAHRPA